MNYLFASFISAGIGWAASDWFHVSTEMSFLFSTVAFGAAMIWLQGLLKD